MDREAKFEKSYIEKMLLDNFLKLMPSFYEMQSSFLSGIYKRYGDLEGGEWNYVSKNHLKIKDDQK